MHRRHIGHHACVRLRNLRQCRDLAQVRHAKLHHGNIMLWFQLQQDKRQAEMIVEISFGFMHAKPRGKHVRDRLFRRCLSRRAGDADQWTRPQIPHGLGDQLQRFQRVLNHN